jgi:hypothetical protein
MTKEKSEPEQAPSTDAPDHECMRCHKGNNDFLGPLTKDRFGWWMHESCRAVTERETEPWR